MRWLFWDPNNAEEAQEHARIDAAISHWWGWFAGRAPKLTQSLSDLPPSELEKIGSELRNIHPDLCWEMGPDGPDRMGLAITPEGSHDLVPLVRSIIDRAPTLPGWRWMDSREAMPPINTPGAVKARMGYDISGARVTLTPGTVRRTDLCFHSPRFRSAEDEAGYSAACLAAEVLLGERTFDTWVGSIEIQRGPGGPSSVSFEDFPGRFQSAVAFAQAARPPEPYWKWALRADWSLMQRVAVEKEDYARREDIFIAQSVDPILMQASLYRFPFSSECFSRHGERFLGVKFDGSGGHNARVAERAAVESAIDDALMPAGIGVHIGGATGLRYFYVDLAVLDIRRALDAILPRLRALELPRRSWILPLDAELSGEWIGVWEDTPPPPE